MNATSQATVNAGTARLYHWVAGIAIFFVLVQAVLAGRGWFINSDLIDIHGYLGSGTLLVVAVQAVVAFLAWRQGWLGKLPFGLSVLLFGLVFAQIGLGYGSRDSGTAASWHVPNGVLIFGLAVACYCLSLVPSRQPAG